MFYVYKLTSPSGRAYVGYTGQTVAERWRQHVTRARRGAQHPLCSAIRKYGAENFTVETVAAFADQDSALASEAEHIAALERKYNLSPGGERDFIGAHARMAELRQDPVWDAQFRANLSAGVRRSERHQGRLPELTAASAAWREGNPRAAWRIQHRATRAARKAPHVAHGVKADPVKQGAAIRAFWAAAPKSARKRRSITARKAATVQWAMRTPHERRALAEKIAEGVRQHHKSRDAEGTAAHNAQLAQARQNIDRSVQAPAASQGLKKFWVELRKDPEAYAAYMAARRVSLQKTLEQKRAVKCE